MRCTPAAARRCRERQRQGRDRARRNRRPPAWRGPVERRLAAGKLIGKADGIGQSQATTSIAGSLPATGGRAVYLGCGRGSAPRNWRPRGEAPAGCRYSVAPTTATRVIPGRTRKSGRALRLSFKAAIGDEPDRGAADVLHRVQHVVMVVRIDADVDEAEARCSQHARIASIRASRHSARTAALPFMNMRS